MPDRFTPDRIIAIREGMCLERSEFAAAIGVSRVEVWRWEELGVSPRNALVIENLTRYEQVMLRASQPQEDD